MDTMNLERMSLRNAVQMNRDELTAIEDGETAYTYFSGHRITRLIRQGILRVRHTHRGKVTELTEEARAVLGAK